MYELKTFPLLGLNICDNVEKFILGHFFKGSCLGVDIQFSDFVLVDLMSSCNFDP